MNRAVLLVPLAVLLFPFGVSRALAQGAQEPPEVRLEFVRKLREKGFVKLALEYLEKLQKAPPAEIAGQLPLEMARTRVALARADEPARRAGQFDLARKELEGFIAKNPKSPEEPQARVELARLWAYQGQALLSQSIREEDDKAANDLARRAEEKFIKAADELEKAAKALPKAEDRIQVAFERGKNFLDQAYTHPISRKRAELIDKAQKVLEEVEKTAISDNSNPALHLARAWLVKCYQVGEAPDKAAAYFKAVMREEIPEARPGQRSAWYFHIQFIPRDLKIKGTGLDKLRLVQTEARAWLKKFPGDRNSPEGYGVRFELAKALLTEAQELSKDPKTGKPLPKSAKAAKLFELAEKELGELARADNDFTEKAAQLSLAIRFQTMGAKTPVAQLKDFDQCYLKARYEMARVQDTAARLAKAAPAQQEELETERKSHLRTAIAAFQRSLMLADDKTKPGQLADARYYLSYVYLMADDPYRAAIVGEALAKEPTPTKRSATAAGYALQAYNSIATATKRPGDLERMRELARYIIEDKKTAWADEPVTQMARYQLAIAALLDKRPMQAVELFEKISKDYPAYIYTQAQLVLTAVGAARPRDDEKFEEKIGPKERQILLAKAKAALARLPQLPDTADTVTARMYFAALLEQGNFLYFSAADHARKGEIPQAMKDYTALDAFAQDLQKRYAKHARRLPEESQEQFTAAIKQVKNRARYGICQMEYRAGEYDKVLAPNAAGAILDEVRKLAGKGKEPIKVADAAVTGEILGFAMRASVQKGKIDQARSILGLLRRLTAEDKGVSEQAGAVLQTLVLELKAQIRELKDKGQKKQLALTVKNFSQFIDELAKEPGTKNSRESILFLAGCYASLEKYAEAANLYAKIPDPKIDLKKKLTPEERKQAQDYWLLQVSYGRALRLAKKFPEARKVLARILSEPKAPGRFLAEKEDIHLLEDQGLYGTAVTRWGQYRRHPVMQQAVKGLENKSAAEKRRIYELVYDCEYQFAYCMYMYGKNLKPGAKRDQWIDRAAGKVVQIEKNEIAWELVGDKFRALLRSEPELRAAYKRQKGKASAGK
jgi:hypothetical protein